jgi:hypothetical protein
VSVLLLLLLLCFVVIIYRFVGQVSGEFGYMCIYTCSWVFLRGFTAECYTLPSYMYLNGVIWLNVGIICI